MTPPPRPGPRPAGNSDDTVRLAPKRSGQGRGRFTATIAAIAAAIVVAAGIGLWFGLRPAPFPLADEGQIFQHVTKRFTVFRFRPDPLILVVDCPGLREQGMMFDRLAALIEKAGEPRDRVLSEAEFKAVLAAVHSTVGTYYYGDDYPASAMRRFFRLAAAEKLTLTPEELRLKHILHRAGFLKPGANGAVISIPQAGPGHRVTLHVRAVILRHELSHGAFFTLPAYRKFVYHFWNDVMTGQERAGFQAFLAREGYDPNEHELIVNETQAYLVFTRDREFFRASAVGLSPATVNALRATFIATMPDFWLRPLATAPLPAAGPTG